MSLAEAIARDAIALPAPFDGASADTSPLDVLKDKLAAADVVCLGEMNHFIHEKSDFRLYLTRWLTAQGWKDFAEELGWSDGVRVSRYLKSGDEMEFVRLPSFNYTGHMRADRDDRPAGILKVPNYPVDAFVSEQKRFYRGLRAGGGRHLFGIDIDGVPGGAYEDIRAWLAPFAGRRTVDLFLGSLEQEPGESAYDEAQRLRDAHASSIASDVGDEITRQVQFSLTALADSLAYITLAYSAPNYEALRPAMAFRENVMKRHFANAENLCGSTRMVLMGHALHLAKSGDPVGGSGIGPGGGRASSLGHHLAQERGLNILSVWMLYGAGDDSQPFPDLPNSATYPPGTLNAALASLGKPLLVPLNNPVFDQPIKVGHMYNAVVTVVPREQTDAIFFLPRVSPLQS